jgi:hypothetical protein
VTPFVRYECLNPQDRVPSGFSQDPSLDQEVFTAGIDVKPLPNVALKTDFQWFSDAARTGTNRFNIALGFLF